MREIQCSNVSVSLKTEQSLCIQARLNDLGNLRGCMNNSIWCVGTMHAMCGQTLRMSEEWDIFRHAWSSGLTLEYTGAALKLFGPFSLVPGLTPFCPLEGLAQPNMWNSSHLWWGSHTVWALLLFPTPQSWDWVGRRQQWDCWGGQISCQLKQKLLKMVKQLRKTHSPSV